MLMNVEEESLEIWDRNAKKTCTFCKKEGHETGQCRARYYPKNKEEHLKWRVSIDSKIRMIQLNKMKKAEIRDRIVELDLAIPDTDEVANVQMELKERLTVELNRVADNEDEKREVTEQQRNMNRVGDYIQRDVTSMGPVERLAETKSHEAEIEKLEVIKKADKVTDKGFATQEVSNLVTELVTQIEGAIREGKEREAAKKQQEEEATLESEAKKLKRAREDGKPAEGDVVDKMKNIKLKEDNILKNLDRALQSRTTETDTTDGESEESSFVKGNGKSDTTEDEQTSMEEGEIEQATTKQTEETPKYKEHWTKATSKASRRKAEVTRKQAERPSPLRERSSHASK